MAKNIDMYQNPNILGSPSAPLASLTPSLFLETGFSLQYSVEVPFHFWDCSWPPFHALPISVLQEMEILVSSGFPFLILFSSFSSPVSLGHLFKNIDLLKNTLNRLYVLEALSWAPDPCYFTHPLGILGPKLNKSKTEVPKCLCQISLALWY